MKGKGKEEMGFRMNGLEGSDWQKKGFIKFRVHFEVSLVQVLVVLVPNLSQDILIQIAYQLALVAMMLVPLTLIPSLRK